jgi:hypothetical protein
MWGICFNDTGDHRVDVAPKEPLNCKGGALAGYVRQLNANPVCKQFHHDVPRMP